MSNLKDWLARDVLIVGKLEASDEVYVPGCGYYQPEQGTHVILCEGAEPLHEVEGEEMAFSVAESLAASENVIMRDLAIENTKLRELVADMWFWRYEGHIDSESQERQMSHIDAVIQRMRELGIEVE